jgi:hypothetical protein
MFYWIEGKATCRTSRGITQSECGIAMSHLMEDHREEQDYHLKKYVEHVDHLGNFRLLKLTHSIRPVLLYVKAWFLRPFLLLLPQ